jgi:hypothetical protein
MQGLAFVIQKTLLRSLTYYCTGNQPHKIQWLLHVCVLDITHIVKASKTTRGNGGKRRGDNSNKHKHEHNTTVNTIRR